MESRQQRLGGYRAGRRPVEAKKHETGRFQDQHLPARVDLRQHMTDVEEQVGASCVANSFVGAYEYLAKRNLGASADVSRLFVYYNARSLEGDAIEDSGTEMYLAINSLLEYGACAEAIWPNDETLLCEEPHADAYEHAANFKITDYEAIETDLNLWRHTLAEGYPIAFALNTFESFDQATQNRGRVPMPKKSDNVRETHGWHAMLCVGYSDKDKMFIVRNSWGPEWGEKGYCYIPYDYVIHPDFNGHDSWIIKSVNDLDFSTGVWEEDESIFSDEDSLLLYEFYVSTTDPDGFIERLDALCLEYVESEDEYYFDYDYEESSDSEDGQVYTLNINSFDLTIEDATPFLEELEALLEEFAADQDYSYSLDGDASEVDEDSEEDEELDEDEEEEEEEELEGDEGEDGEDGEDEDEDVDVEDYEEGEDEDYDDEEEGEDEEDYEEEEI